MLLLGNLGSHSHVDVTLSQTANLNIDVDKLQPFMHSLMAVSCFSNINASCHIAETITEWFGEHDKQSKLLAWPPNSPDLNPSKHLWDVLEEQV